MDGRAGCSRTSSATGRSGEQRASVSSTPRHLDVNELMGYITKKGEPSQKTRLEEIRQLYMAGEPAPEELDDFSRVGMERVEEMLDLFVEPFFFGCEADDPMNAHAFNTRVNPLGAPSAGDIQLGFRTLGRARHQGGC